MTQISEIHGAIPKNELPDRGLEVRGSAPYIPYNNLTRGEMRLSLLLEQANIYSTAFPEIKEYKQAANMLYNALKSGVSNGVNFVGAIYDPLLQSVAKDISKASKNTRSASKYGILGRESIATGLNGIGEPFKFDFDHDCVQYATKASNAKYGGMIGTHSWQWWEHNINDSEHRKYYRAQKALCKTRIEIESIVNGKITDASHHVLYYGLNESFPPIKNSLVVTKHLFHIGGIQGLANATDLDPSLMGTWSETSILRKNASSGVGTVGSIDSSFYLSPDPDQFNAVYAAWSKNRTGSAIGSVAKVGSLAAITALIVAIGTAVKYAADMQRALNEKKSGAMAAAQNYGTVALEAKQSDFNDPKVSTSGSSNNTLIMLGLAAAGAYLLLDDKK